MIARFMFFYKPGVTAADPQAEDMEIDDDDALYLDLRDDRERQAYAMIKNRSGPSRKNRYGR